MKNLTFLTLQCRGSDGQLEKDVGIVIRMHGGGISPILYRICCPHYKGPEAKKDNEGKEYFTEGCCKSANYNTCLFHNII